MTNIYWCIKEEHNEEPLACSNFPLPTMRWVYNESFYIFHNKNNYQAFKNLFQIFLIYKFSFKKLGESFIVSLFSVYVEK